MGEEKGKRKGTYQNGWHSVDEESGGGGRPEHRKMTLLIIKK